MLDQDLYKLTMAQCYMHRFSGATAKSEFKGRNTDADLSQVYDRVRSEIYSLEGLRLSDDEAAYLETIPFLKPDFIDFLYGFRLQPERYVKMTKRPFKIEFGSDICPIISESMFEIFSLAIVNECYFDAVDPAPNYAGALAALDAKIKLADENPGFTYSEFGTRRRRSKRWQRTVLDRILTKQRTKALRGTSNVAFAKELGIKYEGTMGHELLQAAQSMTWLPNAQKWALDAWMQEYQGNLGIALSDVWGIDAFLADFNSLYARMFDGVRHDSGDPFVWFDKVYAHYKRLGIDPKTKTVVFTDGLSFPKAIKLYNYVDNRMKTAFGIGTDLDNDFPGSKPLNIVVKMTECNGHPVAKISDSPGKAMCRDRVYTQYLHKVIDKKNKQYKILTNHKE